MDRLDLIGGQPLRGTVAVGGAKNAALPAMTAALLTDQPVTLAGVPDVGDVRTMGRLLGTLGVGIARDADTLTLHTVDRQPHAADYQLVRQMRASICVLGPLLARRGRARVALPGGCQIGHRPVDRHLHALAALGADIRLERGDIVAEASTLRGATIDLSGPHGSTATGTCNALAAATLARGRSVLTGAAREPEVVDFGRLLTRLGGRVEGLGTGTIEVDGVESLHGTPEAHRIIPDRIEALTLAMAAGMVDGSAITLAGVEASHLTEAAALLTEIGLQQHHDAAGWHVARRGELRPIEATATPYPGLPTDAQAQLTAVLTQADGTSSVADAVFPERFGHVGELVRLGCVITRTARGVVITGPTAGSLVGCDVLASDLRASAALVLAGLAAEGPTRVRRIYHLDRGYDHLERKLAALGARIERVRDEHPF